MRDVLGERRQWPVQIRLPDGQPLRGWLQMQCRGEQGSWYCLVTIPLWDTVDPAEPGELTLAVPASHVERLEGVTYEGVPISRGVPEPERPWRER